MFDEFIQHFASLDDKQIVKDIRKSIEDLTDGNAKGKSFGAQMVKSEKERIKTNRPQRIEAGKKGGFALAAKYRKIKELTAQNNDQVTTTQISTNDPVLTTPNAGGSCGEISDAASKSATSCDTLKADGDIREDSQAKPDGSAITRNETRHIDALEPSANHYATRQANNGDAATREGADESTTVSRNMRCVPQNEAPAHGFSGGRTAQGTMSRSPEATAQSGKASALDGLQDKDGQSAKTRDNSEHSRCRYAQPSCSPEDGNHYDQYPSISTDNPQPEGLTGPSHGGSVASLEARESRRTGAAPERVKNKPSSHCGKAPVRSFGEYGLVHMTDSQANNLRSYYGEDFDRAVGILENYILSLPSKAEGDEKGEAKLWREDYAKRNHYFAMRRDNWVDNALKKAKTADKRLENASNPNYKSFKQQDLDARTEFFSKSIFDGKEAI